MALAKNSFYLSIWRQAFHHPMHIPCLDMKEALAIRLKMYVAARPYRSLEPRVIKRRDGSTETIVSPGLLDMDLHTKILGTEIIIEGHDDGSATLTVRPEWMNERLMRISKATGVPFGPRDDEAMESLKRIQENLAMPETETPKLGDYLKTREALVETKVEKIPVVDEAYEEKQMEELKNMSVDDLYGED